MKNSPFKSVEETVLSLIKWLWGNEPTLCSPMIGYKKYNNNLTDPIDIVEAVAYLEDHFKVILDDAGIFRYNTLQDMADDISLALSQKNN